MNSFFNKLNDYAKTGVRKIRDAAKTAADKIKESAKKAKQRLAAVVKIIRQAVQDKISSLKDSFKRSSRTAASHVERQEAGSDSETNHGQQTEEKSDFQNGSSDGAEQEGQFSGNDSAAAQDAGAAEASETKRAEFRHHTAARSFFTHAADFLAGLLFLSAIVIALKPQLLGKALGVSFCMPEEKEIIRYTEKIGSYLIQLKITEDIEQELKIARNVFVALFLALYAALKIFVLILAASHASQKIVSALMIALTLIACTLLSENFLIFSAVCLIASLAFAFSCGFPAQTIVRKFAVFIVVALCCYVAAHILTDYNDSQKSLHGISEALVQFGENAAGFFSALWLPIP